MPLIRRSIDPVLERVSLTWSMPVLPERVWWGLTDPEPLPHWLGTLAAGEFATDNIVRIKHAEDYYSVSTILDCEPERLLSMTWDFPDEPRSVLRISLSSDAGATQMTLLHTGLGAETASYLPGWHTHLLYLEGLLAGRPLDPAGFWGTYEQLAAP
ncbi:SRPBCC domain-containing protein [Arthrobacter yangruifuii]|uniref:SRPBCC domain-containing protein n=1 Tax=Arthrobacter yangruifuii TaxID=2606616 RepID=UPI0011B846E0|nr:SRPBCC domain-containing protein [Arthrobacter yangruifuii]